MKILLTKLLVLSCLSVLSAQPVTQLIQEYYDVENYAEGIKLGEKAKSLDAEGHFYLGLCYFGVSKDREAIKSFDRSLRKNRLFAPAYFFKGNALAYLAEFDEALKQYDLALSIEPVSPDYLSAKGDAFYSLAELDSAIFYYSKAINESGCPASTILMLGQSYTDKHEFEKALSTYQRALQQLDYADESYFQCCYNIAMLGQQLGQYDVAEEALLFLIQREPTDYALIPQLIQLYYAQDAYEQGNAWKQQLYAAFQRGELPVEMIDRGFCFDRFDWNGKQVHAFEHFAEPNGIFYKHIFYITADDQVEMTIQTEHSQAVRMTGNQFVLGKTHNGKHFTYFDHLFDSNFQYDALKKAVIKVLRGKSKPSSSFSSSN